MNAKEAQKIAKDKDNFKLQTFCKPIFEAIEKAAHKGEFSIEYPYDKEINPASYLRDNFDYWIDYRPKTKNKPERWFISWNMLDSETRNL
jgi:hypothetical protein